MNRITLQISPEKEVGRVPEYFFGHFLEYMHDCIDPGLWAQLLYSRGFENPDDYESGISAPWEKCGEDAVCAIDTKKVYTPRQSQRIAVETQSWAGICQKNLLLTEKTVYEGYIWAYCERQAEIKVALMGKDERILSENVFDVQPGEWEKFAYTYENEEYCECAEIRYLVKGPGTVWLDQTSLCPKNAVRGSWPEVIEKIRGLKPAIMRFPGGCAADCYFWKEGIGPRDLRPGRRNEHWGGTEQNQFGTDEFLDFCEEIGCEPLICVNFGSASPEEAADWVEYCNGSTETVYGSLRAKNGHPRPYGVQYWEIGNEVFGEWEIGHCSAKEYAERYLKYASAMRERDPSIKLLACGGDGNSVDQAWNRTLLEICRDQVDQLSVHLYAPIINSREYQDEEIYPAVTGFSAKAKKVLEHTLKTIEESGRKIPLALTEWNCNYGEEDGTDREQTLESAIANAGLLNLFLRYSKNIGMTNASDLINGWPGGLIRSARGQAFGSATYYLLQMYAQAAPQVVVECSYACEGHDTPALGNLMEMKDVPYVDIVCCKDDAGRFVIFAVNRHQTECMSLSVPGWNIAGGKMLWHENVLAMNTAEHPETIVPKEIKKCGTGEVELLPHAAYMLYVTPMEDLPQDN